MRIADAARSLGMTSVSVCAPEDVESPHVLHADEHVVLKERGGGGTAIGPYLDIEGLTGACVERGVDYVHPGECEVHVKVVAVRMYRPFTLPLVVGRDEIYIV